MCAGYRDCLQPREFHRWTEHLDHYEEMEEEHDGSIKGIANLFNEGNKTMQLIIAQKTPTDAILSYHSRTRAYSLYPYETFVCERNLVTGRLRNRFVPPMAISKYKQREELRQSSIATRETCGISEDHIQQIFIPLSRYDKEYVDAMTEWIESGEGAASGSTVSSDDESDTSIQF
ncbi:hypothetical protein C8J56DRAFT_888025 [Mycena floridula]|nr:hypothetical protein C8J56DRAFT_888025 [Mycena floridula]